jgi:hypothetical protein
MLNCDSKVQMCALINDSDTDFGEIAALPDSDSEKICSQSLSHLSDNQQRKLLNVLNTYPSVFSNVPG